MPTSPLCRARQRARLCHASRPHWLLLLLNLTRHVVQAQFAYGPAGVGQHYNAGWVAEHYKDTEPSLKDGMFRVQGDSRAYLVQDSQQTLWQDHKYVRLDLQRDPLAFTLDLSKVPCGCLACVYMVKMKDPSEDGSNYCDMAENTRPGLNGEECIELDVLEANNW